ncbi:Mitochondrial thiamine pyrophosphate carrier 1 [Penicillium maclennaniae]|uniref:Mitochondrial thiamine pyrophosphate carrier 1 n=1 Tax=Penicillium maclennaniae TaxID=1343394 RepID=UPI00254022AA|nr:Mitochondrial thiamine pyrophosphate carrier 1 [Penicillium maclennaniae]KAJ5675247.1 Mitochondrial thiamine pyrophosphate carrier 1 [Penicillium maclennaniae]
MSAGGEHLKDEGTKRQVVLAGGAAGLISRFCIAPLDVVKIRLQLQIHSLSDPISHRTVVGPIYKGTLSTLRAIAKAEGITGLWKGNVPAEMMYVCYGALQFTTYRATTQALAELPYRLPPSGESFVSGAVAGGLATTTTYPLDLLRTRFAAQGSERIYRSLFGSIIEIAQHEGPAGFFRGCSAAVAQIIPYMGLFFTAYEGLRPVMARFDSLPFGTNDAAAGVVASVLAKTGVFPLRPGAETLAGPRPDSYALCASQHSGIRWYHQVHHYDSAHSGCARFIPRADGQLVESGAGERGDHVDLREGPEAAARDGAARIGLRNI